MLMLAFMQMGLLRAKCRGGAAARVALASFEGSGNHFARHLLEQAVGVLTGANPTRRCA